MIFAKDLGEFKLPPAIDGPWSRLANKGGSRSDFKIVIEFLAKLWGFDPSDPRAFDQWLVSLNLNKKQIPVLILADYKKRFENEQESKLKQTRHLLEGLALGPYARELFTSLSGVTTEFKRLAYRTSILVFHNEDIVFCLSALSQESPQLAQESIADLPSSTVLFTFLAYLRGARAPLAFEERKIEQTSSTASPVESLFQLMALPLADLRQQLERMEQSATQELVRIADVLIQRLPSKAFGKFAKLNLAVFICTADPKNQSVQIAKENLIASGEPLVADILASLGKECLLAELRKAGSEVHPGRERFIAALIDAFRVHYSESINELREQLELFAHSKHSVVKLAAAASLLQLRPKDHVKFQKALLTKLRGDREHLISEWLLRNPEFVEYLRTEKTSVKTLKAVVERYKTKRPALALKIIGQMLREPAGPERYKYWEEGLIALATIGGDEADSIFCDFVVGHLKGGWEPGIHNVVAGERSQALVRRNFWKLLDRSTNEEQWEALFRAYGARSSEVDLVGVIESTYARGNELSAWVAAHLLPKLLEDESLKPNFQQSIRNRDLMIAVAKHLSERSLQSFIYLRGMGTQWDLTRQTLKTRLLFGIKAGIRIALHNSAQESKLSAHLMQLSRSVEEWSVKQSPSFDSTIETQAPSDLPDASRPSLELFFSKSSHGPNDFALFAGSNSAIVDAIFGQARGPWPKPEILLAQIIQSFLYLSRTRRRAEAALQDLPRTIKVELAAAIRDTINDIEEELAGYFIFRDILKELGFQPVMEKLGERVDQKELSSDKHKLIRDPSSRGHMRAFTLGLRIDDLVVGSAKIMRSGDDDDRD